MNLAMKQLVVIGLVTLGYVLGHVSCSPKHAEKTDCIDTTIGRNGGESIAPAKP
ncbi:hypothetical protein [Pseudoalteromonas aurantia]|uniref:Uncharacterized protein n=1 Tax=Pseudoalteromonas aurantia 208 TaxID=1314867 RepID=A0ABR9EET9_9GAMM|nr:hypothetical protein [Pseudoalteromonas aurantia]MBE0368268.1 hypothetical protein [Pseudoalteromonas aurantia 208]